MSEELEPAFPVSWEHDGMMIAEPGMSLRDYFASRIITQLWPSSIYYESKIQAAEEAYRMADVMLSVRKNRR